MTPSQKGEQRESETKGDANAMAAFFGCIKFVLYATHEIRLCDALILFIYHDVFVAIMCSTYLCKFQRSKRMFATTFATC